MFSSARTQCTLYTSSMYICSLYTYTDPCGSILFCRQVGKKFSRAHIVEVPLKMAAVPLTGVVVSTKICLAFLLSLPIF